MALTLWFAMPLGAAAECASSATYADLNGSARTRDMRCVERGGPPDRILVGRNTPIIIIATGKSADYRMTSAEDGVWFDIDADGAVEKIAWTAPDSDVAFLAIDRDGDGRITSGRELFGSHTLPGVANGFDALIQMAKDTNKGIVRHSVSADDPLFDRLLLWTDTNHNGISELSELRPLGELFAEIGLGYEDHNRKDGFGNQFPYRGWVYVRTAPGRNEPDHDKGPQETNARRRFIYDVALMTVR
jgi:hypothetical protein